MLELSDGLGDYLIELGLIAHVGLTGDYAAAVALDEPDGFVEVSGSSAVVAHGF
jgi:hypothetical protein